MNFEFLIKSALLLALLYGGFALLLSRETFHRFNRLALLTVMIMSLVLPAIEITAPSTLPLWGSAENAQEFAIALWNSFFETKEGLTSNPFPKEEGNSLTFNSTLMEEESNIESEKTTEDEIALPQRGRVEVALYLAGVLGSIGFFLFQLFRFWRDTKGGTSTRDEEGNTIVIRGGEFAPYSFLHYIIISVSDYERLRKPILAHEQAHIRLGHSWDLLLLEVVKAVQWFNPFVYLLGRDLKAVHEYEADNAVLNQGIDAKTYQLLLVTKAVGNRLQTLGNNLSHHSLKKRIKMMHKKTSNRWMMTKGIVLPALMALAVVAFAKPKVEDNLQETQISSEKLVTFKEDDPNRFAITIPKGIWREAKYKWYNNEETRDVNKSFIQENTTKSPYWSPEGVTLKLNGNVVNPHDLADMPASALKKMEQNAHEREINLITTPVQIPTSQKDDNKIYDVVDVNASFPDGIEACYKWIKDQIKFPEDCKIQGISGRVMTQFTVNKDGSLSNIKALQSPHASLSKEAIRVVNAMPKWKPAKVKGKVVRSYFRLPINFRLPDTEKKVTVIQGKPSGEVTVIGPTGQVIDNTVFSNPETRAEFPGGEEAMYKWIADHLKYPEECKAKNIQGRVTAQFVVNTDGSITEIKAIKSPDDVLSQEAIRVLSAMPKWKPATSDGKNPVRSLFRLPMNFRLPPAQTEQNPNN